MTKIEKFVYEIFDGVEMNEELKEQKEELVLNMTDRFRDLLEKAVDEEEAYDEVVNNFGSVEEFKQEIGLTELKQGRKMTNLKRLLIVAAVAFGVIMVVFFAGYKSSREYVVQDLNKISYELNKVVMTANHVERINDYNITTLQNAVHNLDEFHDILIRDMNFFEKKTYDNGQHRLLFSGYVPMMQEKLAIRSELGYWSELDDVVTERYLRMTEDLLYYNEETSFRLKGRDLDDESVEKNQTMSLITSEIDITSMTDLYYELNLLAACYVNYTKLPENVYVLDAVDVKEILDRFYDEEARYDITLDVLYDVLVYGGVFQNIEVDHGDISDDISVEAVYGRVNEIHNFYDVEDKPLNEVYLVGDVEELVGKIFGNHGEYRITYLEESRNFSSNTKFYSYEILPYYYGYPIYFRYAVPEIHFSAYDFDACLYFGEQEMPTEEEIGEHEIGFEYDVALEMVFDRQLDYLNQKFENDVDIDDFKYVTTGFSYSYATGKYDLMHVFDYAENGKQLNVHAKNGVGE